MRQGDWVVGAALCVGRAGLEQVGGFDRAYQMYSEEVEWCLGMRRHGWTIDYLPDVVITHHEGASTLQDVERSHELIENSDALLTRAVDAETGQRAYLLTGEEPFLQPYGGAREDMARSLDASFIRTAGR